MGYETRRDDRTHRVADDVDQSDREPVEQDLCIARHRVVLVRVDLVRMIRHAVTAGVVRDDASSRREQRVEDPGPDPVAGVVRRESVDKEHVGSLTGNRVCDAPAVERLEILERRADGLGHGRAASASIARKSRMSGNARGSWAKNAWPPSYHAELGVRHPSRDRLAVRERRDPVVLSARDEGRAGDAPEPVGHIVSRPSLQLFGFAADLFGGLVGVGANARPSSRPARGRRDATRASRRRSACRAVEPRARPAPRPGVGRDSAADRKRHPRRRVMCNTTPAARRVPARSPPAPPRPSRRSSPRPPGTVPSRPHRAAPTHRRHSRPSNTDPVGSRYDRDRADRARADRSASRSARSGARNRRGSNRSRSGTAGADHSHCARSRGRCRSREWSG